MNGGTLGQGHRGEMAYLLRKDPHSGVGDGVLPEDLQTIVDAAGPNSWIEGEDLVNLCKQRSEEGGSGCNAPGAFEEPLVALTSGCDSATAVEEPPVPLAPPPEASVAPVVQVRRYSWRSYAKPDANDKRREFVGTNKQINTNSLLFSQQEPLVSRVHLMQVVRKIGQQERSRGRSLTVDKFNAHCSKRREGCDVIVTFQPREWRNYDI